MLSVLWWWMAFSWITSWCWENHLWKRLHLYSKLFDFPLQISSKNIHLDFDSQKSAINVNYGNGTNTTFYHWDYTYSSNSEVYKCGDWIKDTSKYSQGFSRYYKQCSCCDSLCNGNLKCTWNSSHSTKNVNHFVYLLISIMSILFNTKF